MRKRSWSKIKEGPSLLLAKQFKCGIRLRALEQKEARNISTSSFHLQDRILCLICITLSPSKKTVPNRHIQWGAETWEQWNIRVCKYAITSCWFQIWSLDPPQYSSPWLLPSWLLSFSCRIARGLGRTGHGACSSAFKIQSEGSWRKKACAHTWDSVVKGAKIQSVATSLCMFVSERERTMTHTHRVRVIKYNWAREIVFRAIWRQCLMGGCMFGKWNHSRSAVVGKLTNHVPCWTFQRSNRWGCASRWDVGFWFSLWPSLGTKMEYFSMASWQ